MKIIVCENYEEMSKEGAKIIADLLKTKPQCFLGLATGSTPAIIWTNTIPWRPLMTSPTDIS